MSTYSDVDASVEERRAVISARYPGWRVGRGGSGRWWAVRGAEHVWAATAEDLEIRLGECAP